ncbi:unnamed protein product [Cylicocyclus nassatus]|uniref:Uncharacterized protein n=1 Tax=Cylicocyclus nassatus TaxID=53992 RepID=A0AA36GNY2_CYLNA|nr:unnamed protein product [Cylicocyclus nassatus]
MIDYVLGRTGEQSLYYFCHSQGCQTMFVQLSINPQFGTKIRKIFALAPAYTMTHVGGILHQWEQTYEMTQGFFNLLGDREFFDYAPTRPLAQAVCDNPVTVQTCIDILVYINGPKSDQFNCSRTGVYLSHTPAGTSAQNMRHFVQLVRNKRLMSYDRGPEQNLRCYGSICPPEYNIGNVNADIYIFYSDCDWIVSAGDIEQRLIPALPPSSIKQVWKLRGFNHGSFMWGLRATPEIYEPIAAIIKADQMNYLHNGI